MKLIESFPQIADDNKLLSVFQETELLKIVVMQNTNTANVYVQNDTLIHRRDIKSLEKKLNAVLFPREDGCLKILDQYLHNAKTAEEIFRLYQSSFLEEISEKGNVFRTVYLSSKVETQGDKLCLKIKDSSLDRHYGGLLRSYFLNTYKERFGIDVAVDLEYIKTEEKEQTTRVVVNALDGWTGYSEEAYAPSQQTTPVENSEHDKIVQEKVSQGNNSGALGPVTGKNSASTGKGAVTANNSSAQGKQNFSEAKKTAYDKVKFKKKKLPEDPDIFFGRPFEGSCIAISEIQDEIGDVVIQGKVLDFEDRELKIEKHLFTFSITDFTDTIKVKLFLKEEPLPQDLSLWLLFLLLFV